MACGSGCRPNTAADALLDVLLHDHGLCDMLQSRRVSTVRDLMCLSAWELRDWLLVPEGEAAEVLARAWAACAVPIVTAWDLANRASACVPTPLPSLNDMTGGGLCGAFAEVGGPPGAGKTQFCLHLAALCAIEGGEVFWLDTERTFTPPRVLELLENICRSRPAAGTGGAGSAETESPALSALRRIRRRVCSSLHEVHAVIAELVQHAQQGEALPALVIVDSIAAVARNEGDPNANRRDYIPRRQAALNALASLSKVLVAAHTLSPTQVPPSVVVTNQVRGDIVGGTTKVALGHVWHHAVNWRLVLSHLPPGDLRGHGSREKSAGGRRYLHVEKSPCAAPLAIEFVIDECGLNESAVLGRQ